MKTSTMQTQPQKTTAPNVAQAILPVSLRARSAKTTRYAALALTTLLLLTLGARAADIDNTGTTVSAGVWGEPGVDLYIGHTASGTLTINGSGTVLNKDAYAGAERGAVGRVTVSDQGFWNNHGSVTIGNAGSGVLVITDGTVNVNGALTFGGTTGGGGTGAISGGLVTVGELTVGGGGYNPDFITGGSGALTVTGGTVQVQGDTKIGNYNNIGDYNGSSVSIGGDAYWQGQDFFVGYSRASAVLDLIGSGSIQTANSTIGLTNSASGSARVGDNARWDAGALNVGASGTGDLAINGHGAVFSTGASIGTDVTGTDVTKTDTIISSLGRVTVSDQGLWHNDSEYFTVGASGSGVLTVNGGTVQTTHHLTIGGGTTGHGAVSVSGYQNSLYIGDTLTVGDHGTGILTISDIGYVNAGQATIGHGATGHGTVS
ncbi:MAG: hypothetical protein LBK60_01715, partial [Verrucomicrobiales bacterium]|nr:hypothetical protein [Verrucomicrobiales bacterium]